MLPCLELSSRGGIFSMNKIRFLRACETSPEQRRQAHKSALYLEGDLALVWVSEGDLLQAVYDGKAEEVVDKVDDQNLLPKFHELLGNAAMTCKAVDDFDLDSSSDESKTEWDRLRKEDIEAKSELISFIRANKQILPQILSLML